MKFSTQYISGSSPYRHYNATSNSLIINLRKAAENDISYKIGRGKVREMPSYEKRENDEKSGKSDKKWQGLHRVDCMGYVTGSELEWMNRDKLLICIYIGG